MSKDRYKGIPSTSLTLHDSFATQVDNISFALQEDAHRVSEENLRYLIVTNSNPEMYRQMIDTAKSKPLTLEDARKVVGIEAAALMLNLPQLFVAMPSFPYLYRLFRTLELSSGFKRGGKTLFVGSGLTIHEVIAHFISPPSLSMVTDLFQKKKKDALFEAGAEFTDNRRKKLEFPKPTQLLEGYAFAMEPDETVRQKIKEVNEDIGVPLDKITMIPLGVGKAITSSSIPSGLDSIIWNKAEPKIFFDQHQGKYAKRARHNIKLIIGSLLENLAPAGQFLFTVGRGNNIMELKDRVFLETEVHAALPKLGHKIIYANRDFRITQDEELFGTMYGCFGGIASVSI